MSPRPRLASITPIQAARHLVLHQPPARASAAWTVAAVAVLCAVAVVVAAGNGWLG